MTDAGICPPLFSLHSFVECWGGMCLDGRVERVPTELVARRPTRTTSRQGLQKQKWTELNASRPFFWKLLSRGQVTKQPWSTGNKLCCLFVFFISVYFCFYSITAFLELGLCIGIRSMHLWELSSLWNIIVPLKSLEDFSLVWRTQHPLLPQN